MEPFFCHAQRKKGENRGEESRQTPALIFRLFNVDPHSFTPNLGVINQIHQLCHPVAGFEYHTFWLVLPQKDAALCVFDGVAWMDADALEHRDIQQDGYNEYKMTFQFGYRRQIVWV